MVFIDVLVHTNGVALQQRNVCIPEMAYTIKIERRKRNNRNDRDTHIAYNGASPSKLLFKIAQKSHVILNVNHVLIVYSVHLLRIYSVYITICAACAKACSSRSVLTQFSIRLCFEPYDKRTHTCRSTLLPLMLCRWCCIKFATAYIECAVERPPRQANMNPSSRKIFNLRFNRSYTFRGNTFTSIRSSIALCV